MSAGRNAQHGYAAEEFVAELFRRLGYEVLRNVRVLGMEVDLVIQRDGLRSPVEVTVPPSGKLLLHKLRHDAVKLHTLQFMNKGFVSPIIVIVGEASAAAKDFAQGQFDLRVWDLDVLREKARPYGDLYQSLITLVGTQAEARANATATLQDQRERDDAASLIHQLESHEQNGVLSPSEYERLCLTVFAFLFDPFLYGFETQTETSDGSNRYDFVCRIKSGNPFWDSIRADFRTRSILFECKNYKEPITADQVYSTERYLFLGALRTVCFLISRKGADEGCHRAAQGALRESGKLVLLLSNKHLWRCCG